MTQLKTLKDLEKEFEFEQEAVWVQSLKQEAINWINRKRYDCPLCGGLPLICQHNEHLAIIEWIKHFFNIDEEELK